MEEKKYHIEESKIAGDKVCEPSPTHRLAASSASSASSVSWDEAYDTDSYPMGRSLEQVMEYCAEVEKYLDDPDRWISIDEFEAQMRKAIPGWK